MSAPLQPEKYKSLTFDCYGTLIDWESGIVNYLQPILGVYDVHVIDEFVLELFSQIEPEVQAQGGRYTEVLQEVLRRFGKRLAFTPSEEALHGFAESIAHWQPYPDSVRALQTLGARFSLNVVSNIDDDLFAHSRALLGAQFDNVITAERVGAYKPDARMFETLLKEVEGPVLHVGQSLYHDVAPANAAGLDTVWINRGGASAARTAQAEPNWTFESLQAFSEAMA